MPGTADKIPIVFTWYHWRCTRASPRRKKGGSNWFVDLLNTGKLLFVSIVSISAATEGKAAEKRKYLTSLFGCQNFQALTI